MNEIVDPSGKFLGDAVPSSFQELQKLAVLTNTPSQLAVKSLGDAIPSSFQELQKLAVLTNTPSQLAVKSLGDAIPSSFQELQKLAVLTNTPSQLAVKSLGYTISSHFQELQKIAALAKTPSQQEVKSILQMTEGWKKDTTLIRNLYGRNFDYLLPSEIAKLQASVNTFAKLFANKNLNILFDDLLEDTSTIADSLQEKNFTELDTTNPKILETLLNKILSIYGLLQIILGLIGVDISPLKIHEYFASSRPAIEEILAICEKLSPTGKIYSTRTVDAPNGLILRKYDSKNSKAITTLADGKLLCVLKEPKDNARWILVASQLEDGEIVKGYVSRKFTKQLN